MVEVKVDLQKTFNVAVMDSLVQTAVSSAVQTSLAVIKDKWQRKAQQKLSSTRMQYLMGLDFKDSVQFPYNGNSNEGAVILKGKLPNMIEDGYAPFDMKDGFALSSKKKPTKSGGWELTIPIRHGTPKTFEWGKPMEKEIYAQAKKLKHLGSLSIKDGQVTSWAGYQHKNNVYDGLTRVIKDYGGTKQSQYVTFRKVTDKSEPNSWMHPGYKGVHIADELKPYAKRTFEHALKINLEAVFGGDEF